MTTMNVLDAAGATVALEKPLTPGRSAAATSRPVALSTEDKTALDAIATAANQASQITQETAINTVLGITTGAAVTTSVAGTIQGYLRGIVSLLVSGIAVATHAVTQSGTWTVQPGNTANTTAWKVDGSAVTQPVSIATAPVLVTGAALIGRTVADASAATGGVASTARLASAAASTNATLVKGSAGRVYCIEGKNNAAYDVFLVLYDSAASPPVPGSTTIRKKVVCPAGQAFIRDYPLGLSFATGIGYAFTKLVADADTTVLVAADITAFNMDYV